MFIRKYEPMDFEYLEKIQLRLPKIGIGTWKYRGGVEPIRKAVELGANLVDTAEFYGTEEIVAEAIKGLRDQVIISTKVWPSHFRYKDVIKAAEGSLRRLKTDHIDLYQLHWPNPTIPISETMQAMELLVDAGKIRFIGVSNFSVHQLKKAHSSMKKHRITFNQVRYNLIDRQIENRLLPYCRANDILVVAYSPLGGGLNYIRAHDKKDILDAIANKIGKTCAQVVLNWCISKEKVVVIPKANSIGHVLENCGSAGWRLSEQQMELLTRGIRTEQGPIERVVRSRARKVLEIIGMRRPIYKIEID